jgi:enoyl-[acyl-carrier protein] reductase I
MIAAIPTHGESLLQKAKPYNACCGWKVLAIVSLFSNFGLIVLLSGGQGHHLLSMQADHDIILAGQYAQPMKAGKLLSMQAPGRIPTSFAQPVAPAALDSQHASAMAWQVPQSATRQFMPPSAIPASQSMPTVRAAAGPMKIDLTGKVAFLCGASSEKGFGWAIAKELAEAGATVLFGTWPKGLKIFQMNYKKPALEEARRLPSGGLLEVAKVYPLDAVYDEPSQVPEEVANNKRYKNLENGFTIQEVVDQVEKDYGKIDILVHALANGPEVGKPLLETSRAGYLEASSASAYSLVSMVSRFGKIMNPGGSVVSISYIASQKVVPGYGGGMSSAKAQLESDTRTLAYEAGRKYGIRINSIMAGPMASRAATGIGGDDGKPFIMRAIEYSEANSPLSTPLTAKHVGTSAFFLLTELSAGVTGVVLPVDMGLHAMGLSLDSPAWK